MKTKAQQAAELREKEEQSEVLSKTFRALAQGGKVTVYSIIRSVSRDGMHRQIDFFVIEPASGFQRSYMRRITYSISKVTGWKLTKKGLKVYGCGMDMADHTVDYLQRSLPELAAHNVELVSCIL